VTKTVRKSGSATVPSGRTSKMPGATVKAMMAAVAGWILGDAGELRAALTAYRRGFAAATAARDRSLAGHVLGSASHLLAARDDSASAVELARAALAGAGRTASAGTRALLLQRVAFGLAALGRRRDAEAALTAAERAAERWDVARDPPWLYWLDAGELAAMTGRCLAALGRPLRAEPLLAAAVARPGQPRTSALYGAWLARTYLDLGEAERACEVASAALLDAVRAGSPRACAALGLVDRRLRVYREQPAGRRYAALAAAARAYLATPSGRSEALGGPGVTATR
jgi:tetratricopeptide (TPR) repeat protein